MRALPTILFTLLCTSTVFAEESKPTRETSKYANTEEPTLNAQEVQRYAAVYYAPIRACYLQHGRAAKGSSGELALKLVVHRDGYVHEFSIDAPGVKGKALKKLDACIRNEALTWHFPPRRDFTTAILPYYFMYLDIPGAGPQYSCWNPKGCPRAVRPAKAATGKTRR
jgi:hypothetical protein